VAEVVYDEIDSSRMIDEETMDLILQQSGHPLAHKPDANSDHDDHQVVGANMERYTGREFHPVQLPIHGWIGMQHLTCSPSLVAMVYINSLYYLNNKTTTIVKEQQPKFP